MKKIIVQLMIFCSALACKQNDEEKAETNPQKSETIREITSPEAKKIITDYKNFVKDRISIVTNTDDIGTLQKIEKETKMWTKKIDSIAKTLPQNEVELFYTQLHTP